MHRILAFAVLITFASIATATDSQKRLIRGLWSLTTQTNRIELADVQRMLALQPSHYDVQESKDLADPWALIYILKEKYRIDTEGTDPVNAIYFGQIQLVVLEGPPPDVGPRQKVKIILKSSACVSAKSIESMIHVKRAATTTPQFQSVSVQSVSGQMQNTLDLDPECGTTVQITKLLIPPPWKGNDSR